MFEISMNNVVTMTAGDYGRIVTNINMGTLITPDYYDLENRDKVYFGIMEPNQAFENAIVRKVFTRDNSYILPVKDSEGHIIKPGAVDIRIESEDTMNLVPGTYYYCIKLLRPAKNPCDKDKIYTLLDKKKFIIID